MKETHSSAGCQPAGCSDTLDEAGPGGCKPPQAAGENAWKLLESLPGVTAVPAVWRRQLGVDFEAFRQLCLQAEPWQAESFPCPHCGCWHQVSVQDEGGVVLREECPVLPLPIEEITPLGVNRAKLAREICRALGLESKFADMPIPNTFQAGSWSADAVPVLVSIQTESNGLRLSVAELALRLQRPFILLAPTTHLLTAACDELLAHARAGFFALSSIVRLTPHGALVPARPPGELFARFAPQPKEPQDNAARQLFALAKALDSDPGMRKAPPSAVLRLYCVEGMGAEEIARRLRCAPSLVWARLKLLAQKLGRPLSELREYSGQFQRIDESLSDSRAKSIHLKGQITGDAEDEETEE